MIDFTNGAILKLSRSNSLQHETTLAPLLVDGETVLSAYSTVRDFVVFTNKRIIAVNVQGLTGKKKDFSTLPYSKIQAFSVETAGTFDLDAELEIWFSGLGKVKFEFRGDCDITEIGKMISEKIL